MFTQIESQKYLIKKFCDDMCNEVTVERGELTWDTEDKVSGCFSFTKTDIFDNDVYFNSAKEFFDSMRDIANLNKDCDYVDWDNYFFCHIEDPTSGENTGGIEPEQVRQIILRDGNARAEIADFYMRFQKVYSKELEAIYEN